MGKILPDLGYKYQQFRKRMKAQLEPVCGICGGTIDKDLPKNDPGAWVLDHIIPVSKGGDPLDSANVQPSHRKCNGLKADKMSFGDDGTKGRKW